MARANAMIACWPFVNEYKLHKQTTSNIDRSFCVALRPQPIDALASQQPFIDISFALEAPDVPNFGSGVVGLDLPVALRDAVEFENDLGRFAHGRCLPHLGIGRHLGWRANFPSWLSADFRGPQC
jgi:hypothetical protein